MGKNRKPGGSQKPKSAFKIGQKPKTAAQNRKPNLKMGKNRNPPNYNPFPCILYSGENRVRYLAI